MDSANFCPTRLINSIKHEHSCKILYILYVSAMVVLLNHINLPEVTIAVDGSLYEHHPKYHDHMMDVLRKWVPNTKVSCFIIS